MNPQYLQRPFINLFKQELKCPISHQIIQEPVVSSQGHTYNKQTFQNWIKIRMTDPLTTNKLQYPKPIPNHSYKKLVEQLHNYLPKIQQEMIQKDKIIQDQKQQIQILKEKLQNKQRQIKMRQYRIQKMLEYEKQIKQINEKEQTISKLQKTKLIKKNDESGRKITQVKRQTHRLKQSIQNYKKEIKRIIQTKNKQIEQWKQKLNKKEQQRQKIHKLKEQAFQGLIQLVSKYNKFKTRMIKYNNQILYQLFRQFSLKLYAKNHNQENNQNNQILQEPAQQSLVKQYYSQILYQLHKKIYILKQKGIQLHDFDELDQRYQYQFTSLQELNYTQKFIQLAQFIHKSKPCPYNLELLTIYIDYKDVKVNFQKQINYIPYSIPPTELELTMNWNHIYRLRFNQTTKVDDSIWQNFVSHADKFPNIRVIRVENCAIRNITADELSKFPHLRTIKFQQAIFTQDTKRELKRFKEMNQAIKLSILYKRQDDNQGININRYLVGDN